MLIARTPAEVRAALTELRTDPRRGPTARVSLVPTMGALHDGHLSLLRAARADAEIVVLSLFVNPRQFDDERDLAGYPRDEARDLALVRDAGVDLLYAPTPEAVYPRGFATTVSVGGPARGLEGAQRGAAHFDGVATVVAKLLITVAPDVAVFGAKDAQQVAVVRRMVRDLDLPVTIAVVPTVREPGGLAMSSRNARLTDEERERARTLHLALTSTVAAVAAGERDPVRATAAGRAQLAAVGIALEYLTLVDPETMEPVAELRGDALAVVAARVGAVRLIDNLPVPAVLTDHEVATPSGASTA